jgi:hypothetical protein
MAQITDLVQLLVDLDGCVSIGATHVSSVAVIADLFAYASFEGCWVRLHLRKDNVTLGVSCRAISFN